MAFTVASIKAKFPAIQFTGGAGVVVIDGKHVEVGRVAEDNEFVLSAQGKKAVAQLAEAAAQRELAGEAAKPTGGKSGAKAKGRSGKTQDAPVAAPPTQDTPLDADNPAPADAPAAETPPAIDFDD